MYVLPSELALYISLTLSLNWDNLTDLLRRLFYSKSAEYRLTNTSGIKIASLFSMLNYIKKKYITQSKHLASTLWTVWVTHNYRAVEIAWDSKAARFSDNIIFLGNDWISGVYGPTSLMIWLLTGDWPHISRSKYSKYLFWNALGTHAFCRDKGRLNLS